MPVKSWTYTFCQRSFLVLTYRMMLTTSSSCLTSVDLALHPSCFNSMILLAAGPPECMFLHHTQLTNVPISPHM
ncbi:hypothetical protein F5Y09DRAFT_295089 [Xylaria sp. FL1042]|nr:hypothetical protein F5Y09DRAFT_295089 [Xylaria sp. FL1042]